MKPALFDWPCSLLFTYVSSPSLLICHIVSHTAESTVTLLFKTSIIISIAISFTKWNSHFFYGSLERFEVLCKGDVHMHFLFMVMKFCILFLLNWTRKVFNQADHLWTRYHPLMHSCMVDSLLTYAPPSPLTDALFCSWSWSIAIAWNAHSDFYGKMTFYKNYTWIYNRMTLVHWSRKLTGN